MEIIFFFSRDFSRPPVLYYLIIATAFCVVLMTAVRWSKKASISSSSHEEKKQSGGRSMIEPEEIIRTLVLSYLDCASLCKLSMTNSLLRKAANDDNVWKALYHKDFWLEQEYIVTPENGWKAYYAATRAIMNATTQLYKNNDNNKEPMSEMWLNDFVTCIQSPGKFESGYMIVCRDWEEKVIHHEIREIRVRVMKDIGWVTFKFFDPNEFHFSSVFEYQNGRWYMVIHHSSAARANIMQ